MPSETRTPGTATSVGTGSDWLNPDNIKLDDLTSADSTGLGAGGISNTLIASNFGFTLPAGTQIGGISVRIKKMQFSDYTIHDYSVKLQRSDGTAGSGEKATPTTWPVGVFTDTFYGGATDLWSDAWSVDNIKSVSFGVRLAATRTSGPGGQHGYVDVVEVTVYYTAGLHPIGPSGGAYGGLATY